ncbi:MAG TPA: hypothetical protein VGA36_05605, partial [Nitriliruptorales bacterium]
MMFGSVLRLREAVALGGVALLALVVVASAAVGQEAGEPQPDQQQDAGFEVVDHLEVPPPQLPPPSGSAKLHDSDLWLWPEGRRGYVLTGWFYPGQLGPTIDQRLDYPHALLPQAVDLDTLEPVAAADPDEVWWIEQPESGSGDQRTHGVAVDRANGLLYVAHNNAVGAPLEGTDRGTTIAMNKALCHPTAASSPPCFAGVYVLDGRTLARIGNLTFEPLGLDGAGIQLDLMALTFSPPREPGDAPKLHVLLHEAAHKAGSLTTQGGVETYHRTNQHYAVQIDVTTGRTDWMARVGACTGEDRAPGSEGPKGTIFRSPDADRPVVWVGCYAGGQAQGTIARLDLEETETGSRVVGEKRFIAPAQVEAFRADPVGERLLVKTTPQGGALWWVFDGVQGGFVARAGIGRIAPHESGDVVDPVTGRLYTFARPKTGGATLAERHGGGLGFVDMRRQQVPQYRWDHSLSELWTGGVATRGIRIAVDPETHERPRRVFLRPGDPSQGIDGFVVLADTNPITHDPVVQAVEEDRTADVPEQPPATSAQFQGSGRGYGVRVIAMEGV